MPRRRDHRRRFVHRDGATYVCRDARELVAMLHAEALIKSATDEEFMRAMAERSTLFTGHRYRFDTPENFVADLVAGGILSEQE